MQGTSGRLLLEVIPGTQQREKEKAEICQHPESEESWPPVSVCLHSLQEEVLPEPEPGDGAAVLYLSGGGISGLLRATAMAPGSRV